ncbi:MAG: hypothetical protein AB7S26_29890 [Sandaracinaceae bacterium]
MSVHAFHPSRDAIAAFLEAGEGTDELERHLSECDACAELLAREARIEETLHEVAATKPETRRALTGWTIAILAAAASVLVLLGSVSASPRVEPASTPNPAMLDAGLPLDSGAP